MRIFSGVGGRENARKYAKQLKGKVYTIQMAAKYGGLTFCTGTALELAERSITSN
jgi:hypothetical protein